LSQNRILLVEDNKTLAETIAMNLEYAGYEYTVFHNGAEAVASFSEDSNFDLAIVDIMLPGLDGYAVSNFMQNYNIPTVFLTAKADANSKIKGLKEGAEDYITKPFEMLELLIRIERILNRCGKNKANLFFKDVTIDRANRRVTKSGVPIALQPLEYDLLAMLVKYKNCTLPRERLLNEIWGVDFIGGTRTVDLHISRLRKKLGLFQEIVSVSKTGYRLED